MKRQILIFAVLLLAITALSACFHRLQSGKIENVVRVFWHEGTRYSVQTREPGSNEIKTITLYSCMCGNNNKPKIIADVRADSPMWVSYTMDYNPAYNCMKSLEIHIRSERDIEGGGWNHGKFGSGQTTVIR